MSVAEKGKKKDYRILLNRLFSPDYSQLPPETDYRRTLYWNPSVPPDEDGKVNVQFYNNSRCRTFRISAETITPQGVIGVYQNNQVGLSAIIYHTTMRHSKNLCTFVNLNK